MHDVGAPKLHFRTIWISDLHLGTPGCQASLLLEFLRRTESSYLYLVGDIVDGWQLRRRWYWHQSHNDVVQKVLRKARKGTKVVYLPGNHDEFARHFLEIAFVGDRLYIVTLRLNHRFNQVRARLGFPYWSLSQYLEHKVKNAVSYISDFERAVANEAKRRGLDGVVCGHIHKAAIRDVDGIHYCNDGDRVESHTALVENEHGEPRIVGWKEVFHLHAPSPRHEEEPLAAAAGH